jgi:hypothetical protein|tara:strand:+ start:2032 stop:2613 length:582 start_codon:yes stop_codon:yes gene_type:complete
MKNKTLFKKKKKEENKFILDACCSSRMFWFNKKHPNTIFQDIREEEKGFVNNRQNREIKPDIIGDFRNMSFKDKSFKLIIWDPPHIIQKYNANCRMIAIYGSLEPETWQDDLKKGFNDIWRVLDDFGVLIFKWSEVDRWGQRKYSAKLKDIIRLFHTEPLIAQKVKWTKDNQFATYWCCFMKIPKGSDNVVYG